MIDVKAARLGVMYFMVNKGALHMTSGVMMFFINAAHSGH